MAIRITLSIADMTWVDTIAHRRQDEAVRSGRPDRHGFHGRNGFLIHRLGAAGELAVAKAFDYPWDATVNTFKAPDLGGCLQIRTRSEHRFDLMVRPGDKDDEAFVHVTGEPPDFIIHGWLYGHEAKQPQWKQNYGGRPTAYFIPSSELHQLS